jgi:hypothetical protein
MKLEPELTEQDLDTLIRAITQLLQGVSKHDSINAAIDHFLRTFYYASNFMVPYDWMADCQQNKRGIDDPAALKAMDLDALRKRMILHVRRDRFDEGHLLELARNGYLAAVLERAQQLRRMS